MKLCLTKALLTDRVKKPSKYTLLIAKLYLEVLSDGTPVASESVVAHCVKILDPFRLVFVRGYSPMMRVGKHKGMEGLLENISPWLVQALSLFVNKRHIVSHSLHLIFEIRWVGGDNLSY